MVCFLNGLSEAIKDDMATREPSSDLETLFDQAIRLDNRLRGEKSEPTICLHIVCQSSSYANATNIPRFFGTHAIG